MERVAIEAVLVLAAFAAGVILSAKVKVFLGIEAAKAKALGEKEFNSLRKKL